MVLTLGEVVYEVPMVFLNSSSRQQFNRYRSVVYLISKTMLLIHALIPPLLIICLHSSFFSRRVSVTTDAVLFFEPRFDADTEMCILLGEEATLGIVGLSSLDARLSFRAPRDLV